MQAIYIYSDTAKQFISIQAGIFPRQIKISSADGKMIPAPEIRRRTAADGLISVTLDASALQTWTPDHPVVYLADIDGQVIKFGYLDFQNEGFRVLVNGAPFYFRGFIRGIAAHEHPNMTGRSKREFYGKNILQAKKYGFNLVRFHSTIPDEEFVAVADELGLFVHMEIGFSYEYDKDGNKTRIFLDADRWHATIRKYRNHPSVAIFCLGNEMHNAGRIPEAHKLYASGRKLVPGKLIMDNSGWGEYDRTSADIYAQHIAYFFPYKRHADMFNQDFCWEKNGSMYAVPLTVQHDGPGAGIKVTRALNPIRPVMAHETMHYIDFPDYPALERKFDRFCKKIGAEYLEQNKISKPRYMTEIPKLITAKGLQNKVPDYIAASREFKKFAIKTYIERLRLAEKICGYEMLQFADCLKYENQNGVVDCFDDDKFMDAGWFRRFNSDTVLLADLREETAQTGANFKTAIYISHFGVAKLLSGSLRLYLHDGDKREEIFAGDKFSVGYGLYKLAGVEIRFKPAVRPVRYRLEAEFAVGATVLKNSWTIWHYPVPQLRRMPVLNVKSRKLKQFLEKSGKDCPVAKSVFFTDMLNDSIWAPLQAGKTVILSYHRDRKGNLYYWPGALDRFKPCIWDRGNNLGGIIYPEWLQKAMGSGRYFGENLYPLIEEGYKINLDHFPIKVNEAVCGVDKPCRDRMNGLVLGIKDLQPDELLRNFCYLFSIKVDKGTLIVSTFNLEQFRQPAVAAYLIALLNNVGAMHDADGMPPAVLKQYLQETTRAGVIQEPVMNHFWELDNKPVEDTLFWEEAGIDLTKIGD